jgi:hypothetical protein
MRRNYDAEDIPASFVLMNKFPYTKELGAISTPFFRR